MQKEQERFTGVNQWKYYLHSRKPTRGGELQVLAYADNVGLQQAVAQQKYTTNLPSVMGGLSFTQLQPQVTMPVSSGPPDPVLNPNKHIFRLKV